MKHLEEILRKAYLIAAIYIILLIVGFGFVFSDIDLPGYVELFFKLTAWTAAIIVVFWFALYLLIAARTKLSKLPLLLAAYGQLVGVVIVAAILLYVKVKTCNAQINDYRWHCQVEGTSVIIFGLGIPFVFSLAGLFLGLVIEFIRRHRKRPIKSVGN